MNWPSWAETISRRQNTFFQYFCNFYPNSGIHWTLKMTYVFQNLEVYMKTYFLYCFIKKWFQILVYHFNDLSKWSLFCGVYLDYSMLVRARHTAGSCASQPRAKVCGPWNRFISPWQNGRYFAENIFKCIFVNAFSRAGLAVWNVFMTRRVINCHKLCPKQVYNASFRQFRNV